MPDSTLDPEEDPAPFGAPLIKTNEAGETVTIYEVPGAVPGEPSTRITVRDFQPVGEHECRLCGRQVPILFPVPGLKPSIFAPGEQTIPRTLCYDCFLRQEFLRAQMAAHAAEMRQRGTREERRRRKRGRPPLYTDPQLNEKANEYEERCATDGKVPTVAGFRVFIKAGKLTTARRWINRIGRFFVDEDRP